MSKITKSISILILTALLAIVILLTVAGKNVTDSILSGENTSKGEGVALSILLQLPLTAFALFLGAIGLLSSLIKSFTTRTKILKILFIILTVLYVICVLFNIIQVSSVLSYLKT